LGRVDVTQRLAFSDTGRRIYFRDDGSLKRIGDHVDNPDLALTLQRIANHGVDVFYRGEIAQQTLNAGRGCTFAKFFNFDKRCDLFRRID